jgi:hypothetical protein
VLQRLMRERADMLVRENGVIKEALNEERLMERDRNDYTIPSSFVGVTSGAFASTGTCT